MRCATQRIEEGWKLAPAGILDKSPQCEKAYREWVCTWNAEVIHSHRITPHMRATLCPAHR